MKLNEKNIFLLDGIGAVSSAVFTGMLLPEVTEMLGLPVTLLRGLAVVPVTFCVYSFCIYWLVPKTKPWMLMAIILANLFYCVVSGVLVFAVDTITLVGRLLLALEISVVLAVVWVEYSVYKHTP